MRRLVPSIRRVWSLSIIRERCHRLCNWNRKSSHADTTSKVVLQKVRPSAANAVGQMLLLIILTLAVHHKMPNRKQNLNHDLSYRNSPRTRLRSR